MQKKVIDFLRKYRMDPDDIDIESNCLVFQEEMQKVWQGSKAPLR